MIRAGDASGALRASGVPDCSLTMVASGLGRGKTSGTKSSPAKKSKSKKESSRKKKTAVASPSRSSKRPRKETDRAKLSAEQELEFDDHESDAEAPDAGVADASKSSTTSEKKAGLRIKWTDTRIERVIDHLETHVEDRQKLFSDSSKEAAEEGRRRCVAKGSKFIFYVVIAKAVFAIDEDEKLRDAAQNQTDEVAKSVENLITRLKTAYKQFNAELGKTGASLDYSEVEIDSPIYNKIDELKFKLNLPYWDRLHGFWRTLPNFNPTLVTSEAGQDIAGEALKLTHRYDGKDPHEEMEDDGKSIPISDLDRSPSPHLDNKGPVVNTDTDETTTDSANSRPINVYADSARMSFSSALSSRSLKSGQKTSTLSNTKMRAKRSRAEAFSEETAAETKALSALSREKHERKLEEFRYKQRKLDYASQKENHQREREKEAHELQMLRLRLQYQQPAHRPALGGNTFGSTSQPHPGSPALARRLHSTKPALAVTTPVTPTFLLRMTPAAEWVTSSLTTHFSRT
ncbi:hypothetical protein DFH07DRAFT_784287 [Mycena maculata]|uniref:Uncharacterized protein n=1 Tax=Mycena maculata TaxID=230809 RepID=A0AAD7HH97_9AGAR|nr:hypothetical protein DFH07DRAFT_784287 [Mycena maculata]